MKGTCTALTLLCAWQAAAAQHAMAQTCQGAVIPLASGSLPPAMLRLADANVRQRLAQTGCTLIDPEAVAAARKLLELPRHPQGSAPWRQLGKAVTADWMAVPAVTRTGATYRIELDLYQVANEAALHRQRQAGGADVLPALTALADEAVAFLRQGTSTAAPLSAPTTQPVPPPSSQPSAPPAVASTPAPTSADAVSPSPASPLPAAAAPVAAAATEGAITPAPTATAQPSSGSSRPPAAPVIVRKNAAPTMFAVAAGTRFFYFFKGKRAGPALEVELGAIQQSYRMTVIFRDYLGDKSSYLLGGRFEGGPKLGPLRLSFGADLGLLFTPETRDGIDMMVLDTHVVGCVFNWAHLALHLDAFSPSVYLVPADATIDRDPQLLLGFNSGASIVGYF